MDQPPNRETAPVAADLERFRGYLMLLARSRLPAVAAGKLDVSDVVQQTFARAVDAFGELRATDDAQIAAWLRRILSNQMANALRELRRARRDAARERSIHEALEASSARLEGWLASEHTSPSLKAQRSEQFLLVAAALAELPEAQQQAVALHHLGDCTLDEIALRMERSPAAVAGLIKRGLKSLRTRLDSNASTS
jgi:RNA polymerase sigma-70 factor (ECF subfamily)